MNISAENFKEFMDVELVYSEPQPQPGSIRVMIYLRTRLTILTGAPFRTPVLVPNLTSNELNGSL